MPAICKKFDDELSSESVVSLTCFVVIGKTFSFISLGTSLLVGLVFLHDVLVITRPFITSSFGVVHIHALSSPTSDEATSSLSDVFSLEQIRDIDIIAPTWRSLSRDYSLYSGSNNVSCTPQLDSRGPDNSGIDAIYSRCSSAPSTFYLIAPWASSQRVF